MDERVCNIEVPFLCESFIIHTASIGFFVCMNNRENCCTKMIYHTKGMNKFFLCGEKRIKLIEIFISHTMHERGFTLVWATECETRLLFCENAKRFSQHEQGSAYLSDIFGRMFFCTHSSE